MLVFALRVLFVVLAFLVTLQQVFFTGQKAGPEHAFLGAGAALTIVGLELLFRRRFLRGLAAVVFGGLVGIVVTLCAALLVAVLAAPFLESWAELGRFLVQVVPLLTVFILYFAISLVVQTRDDFRFVIPYIDFSEQSIREGGLVLDTSVLIDGRVADVAATGIVTAPLLVPKFVLTELQHVADASDRLKRNRGRRGLDVIKRLQADPALRIVIQDADYPDVSDVDGKIVKFAKEFRARIVTGDYNLNKVAQIEGVRVLNVNDLANAVKPVVLPGEELSVKIIKPGEESEQGVGYLADGTMVVVDQGRGSIGHAVEIVVTSTLQTSAGRMVFGRPKGAEPHGEDRHRARGRT